MSKETEAKEAQAVEQRLENIESALNNSEQFFEKNQKVIAYVALAIIVIAALVWLFKSQYLEPREQEAQKEIFNAQYYFEADSFRLALDGDGINNGFLYILDEYSSTPAGKLANYYAGVCYLQLGEFENAKKYLNDFESDDEILNSMAICLIGDAEVELGNNDAALSLFKKAADKGNQITAPNALYKLGILNEKLGNTEDAKAAYKQIKEKYPASSFASSADKYLESVK